MAPKLSDEQRQALNQQPRGPVDVEDDQTQQIYVLVAKEDFRQLVDVELRRELQVGFDQADRGELAEWDPEDIRREGRRRRDQHADSP